MYLACTVIASPTKEGVAILFKHPVTFRIFIRLCIVISFMTVKEYNRSVEEFADSVYRFIRAILRMKTGQTISYRIAMKSSGDM